MKRGAVVLFLALAVVLGVMASRRFGGGDAGVAPAPSSSGVSAEEKERVQAFWVAFREAETHRRAGRWEEAIPVYGRALEYEPEHEGSLYQLANCYLETDRFAEALASLERLVEVNPLSQRGHLQIGTVRSCPSARGVFDLAAAEKALHRAREINQEETGALLRLAGVALARGESNRAAELCSLANRTNVSAVEGYYLRAYVRWKRGESAQARALLQEALDRSREPVVKAAAPPGEGDTIPGTMSLRSTLAEKQLIRAFWSGLPERFPAGEITETDLARELAELDQHLEEVRKLAESSSHRDR